ncbi:amidohydrolase family protein [Pigmentiphaga litoralis]|uniref:amidohydrolase family protein n=1 Tax=Pigmentiphaga litoralis TaxID=516702 RepID=UPI003B42A407
MTKRYTYRAAAPIDGQKPVLGAWHSEPDIAIPEGACDCHVHIFGPREKYPLAAERTFVPGLARVDDLISMHRRLGVDRTVIVQASMQGIDNRCLLDAMTELRALDRQVRAVAVVAPDVDQPTLTALHDAGVRGLRVNLQSFGETDPQVAARRLTETARVAADMNWHVQTYTTLSVIAQLSDVITQLPVPLVVDHFGLADPANLEKQPGWRELLSLVKAGHTYVKLSAPYRLVDDEFGADGKAMARALIDANPDRMLWGTDWPHTGPWPGRTRDLHAEEPFHPIDDGAMLSMFGRWTHPAERQRILVDNPATLYDFPPMDSANS